MVFAFLVRFAEAQREAIDVDRFLAIDAARLDGLREEFVDSIGGLVVDAGVAFLEGPLELFGHLVLGGVGWGGRVCGRIKGPQDRMVKHRVVRQEGFDRVRDVVRMVVGNKGHKTTTIRDEKGGLRSEKTSLKWFSMDFDMWND